MRKDRITDVETGLLVLKSEGDCTWRRQSADSSIYHLHPPPPARGKSMPLSSDLEHERFAYVVRILLHIT